MNVSNCYEKNITAMKYESNNLHHPNFDDFMDKWVDQCPLHPCCRVWRPRFNHAVLRATVKRPPCGIVENPHLMLAWDDDDPDPAEIV
jgi:hypothetical protein